MSSRRSLSLCSDRLAARVLATLRVQGEQPLAERVPRFAGIPSRQFVDRGDASRYGGRQLRPGESRGQKCGNE